MVRTVFRSGTQTLRDTVDLLEFEKLEKLAAALTLPLGLNAIVVPSASGKDASVLAGMALVSRPLACAAIPLIFLLFEWAFH